jgi:hypothetical protein
LELTQKQARGRVFVSTEVQSKIANALFQLQVINQKLYALTEAKKGIGPSIGREAIGGLGGAFAETLFKTAKAGNLGYSLAKKMARRGQSQQVAAQKASLEYEFKQIVEGLLPTLSEVSIHRPSPSLRENGQLLARRLKRIAAFVNVGIKIPRAIQFLQSLQQEKLIMNRDIPEVIESGEPGYSEAHRLLRSLEEALRKLIEESLLRLSPSWWTTRIPEDVRENAERRKEKDDKQWPWATGADLPPIHYVDFPDYVKIIRRKDNWREAFSRIFHDEELVSSKLRELEPIRNALAHSRPMPKNGLIRLRINTKDILALLAARSKSLQNEP